MAVIAKRGRIYAASASNKTDHSSSSFERQWRGRRYVAFTRRSVKLWKCRRGAPLVSVISSRVNVSMRWIIAGNSDKCASAGARAPARTNAPRHHSAEVLLCTRWRDLYLLMLVCISFEAMHRTWWNVPQSNSKNQISFTYPWECWIWKRMTHLKCHRKFILSTKA